MSANHTKDPKWRVDLLWKYLHEVPANHGLYETILDPVHTNPQTDQQGVNSKVPWNQRHADFIAWMAGRGEKCGALCCGAAVKWFFQKYMKTYPPGRGEEPWAHPLYVTPPPRSGRINQIRFISREVSNAFRMTKALLEKGFAVRVGLLHTSDPVFSVDRYNRKQVAPHHYVGIVAYDGDKRFLYVDPWPGFSGTNTYAGQPSKFLGIVKYEANRLKCICPGSSGSDCVVIKAPTYIPPALLR